MRDRRGGESVPQRNEQRTIQPDRSTTSAIKSAPTVLISKLALRSWLLRCEFSSPGRRWTVSRDTERPRVSTEVLSDLSELQY